jgi:hypothetical protein
MPQYTFATSDICAAKYVFLYSKQCAGLCVNMRCIVSEHDQQQERAHIYVTN